MFPLKDDIPTRRFPIVTVAIIAINIAMYFFFQGGAWEAKDQRNTVQYGAIPYEITHPGKQCFLPKPNTQAAQLASAAGEPVLCEGDRIVLGDQTARIPNHLPQGVTGKTPLVWLTVLTAMFMHGGILHLAGNMLFLWIFGNNIEDSMGRLRFPAFYLVGGLAALLGQVVFDPNSVVPTIGASGAIAAVLGGYALLYPRARVITLILIIFFFTVIELPALWVLGGWFLLQVAYGLSEAAQPVGGQGGVAYFAHIGGFLFGLLTIRLLANRVHDDYERAHRAPVY